MRIEFSNNRYCFRLCREYSLPSSAQAIKRVQ